VSEPQRLPIDAARPLTFRVWGVAQPKGSAKGFIPKGWTRPVITSDNSKNKGWQQLVAEAAGRARDEAGAALLEGPVRLLVAFYLPRPKSLPRKVAHHTKKPDLDKLLRSVKDGLKAVAWHDDSQVVDVKAIKRYADRGTAPHAIVTVESAE
jgi:crossover junction endodeoxyribonuclease RusA